MKNFKILVLGMVLGLGLCGNTKAQTFEVEQIEQLFRPRIRLESKYVFDSNFKDTVGVYNQK